MKKHIILILCIFIIIVVCVFYNYYNYKNELQGITKYNKEYEQYFDKTITGTEMASIINKAIDNNEKNKVQKNERGNYIDNNENSVQIQVKFKESDEIYSIEQIYKLGIDQFIYNYNQMNFKCLKKEYHQSTNYIKYIYFEEV